MSVIAARLLEDTGYDYFVVRGAARNDRGASRPYPA